MNRIIYVGKHALTLTVSRHAHNSWELIYCTSGEGTIFFDDRSISYQAGDIVVIPIRVPHSNLSERGFTNIHINMDEVTFPDRDPFIVRGDSSNLLLDAFQDAYRCYTSKTPGFNVLLPIYGQLIATALTLQEPERAHSSVVLEIQHQIHQCFPDASFDLNAYLHTLPFNCEYLKKLFKKETGLTPLQYLTDRRLENAASVLAMAYGKQNITEVSTLSGFAEPLYFSRLFKKKYGVSPSRYHPEEPEPTSDSDSMKIML